MIDLLRQQEELRRRLEQTAVRESSGGSGTAFPTGIASSFRFFRTDLGLDCYYDGAQWLTLNEYEANLTQYAPNLPPYSAASQTALIVPARSGYNYYVTRARIYAFISPTNTGAAYWSFEFRNAAATSLWSFNTSAAAAGEITTENTAINTSTSAGNYLYLYISAKTGAPSNITALNFVCWYRLVIT